MSGRADEPEVAWKAIEQDAVVVTADGDEVARVAEVTGDAEADIFNGLVLGLGALKGRRYLPAERVRRIWAHRVEVDVTAAEIRGLPEYEEPVAGRIVPDDRFLTRVRRRLGGR
ncbi:MAG TPA: hypothetical protein VFR63_04230 [Gaiellaceae bacterium]|nr:hypothetical protein [Gaiellaceae bacterium]